MISVCIPVHISDPDDLIYLKTAIESVVVQSYQDFEIVIADDSASREVFELIREFQSMNVAIQYFETGGKSGIGANTNNCISKSRGALIKILFQDDYLSHSRVLERTRRQFRFRRKKWLAAGTIHFNQQDLLFQNRMIPRRSDNLLIGKNSISSPSVITFRRGSFVPLATNLTYIIDCEWYLRMSHTYGLPIFSSRIDIVNRLHENQQTHKVQHLLGNETLLAKKMHSRHKMSKGKCDCLTSS
jgi:glycosyltransferase involved in cell wall biosynthesis